jgi:hypothetical protein
MTKDFDCTLAEKSHFVTIFSLCLSMFIYHILNMFTHTMLSRRASSHTSDMQFTIWRELDGGDMLEKKNNTKGTKSFNNERGSSAKNKFKLNRTYLVCVNWYMLRFNHPDHSSINISTIMLYLAYGPSPTLVLQWQAWSWFLHGDTLTVNIQMK